MKTLTATPVLRNKFWIVEKNGEKIATIQAALDGVVYVQNEKREKFVSIKLLGSKYNITFAKARAQAKPMLNTFQVDGFPCDHKPYNALLDVSKKVPIFTKTTKSKSFFCAGYYLIQFNFGYVLSFCPKSITLNRYPFKGPFSTKTEAKKILKLFNQEK